MRSTLRATALSAVLLGALVTSGCGGEDDTSEPTSAFGRQTAAQIMSAARADMKGVRSLTIEGTWHDQEFHVSLADDGTCVGTMEAYGGTAEVIETVDHSYVRADEAYWLGQAETAEQRKRVEKSLEVWDGRWVRTPRAAGYFLAQCDFQHFVPLLTTGDRTLAAKGEEREIDGVLSVAVTADQSGIDSTMWVSVEAPHRVVRLSQTGADAATFSITDYDEPVSIQTPDPAEVYDLAAANKKKAK